MVHVEIGPCWEASPALTILCRQCLHWEWLVFVGGSRIFLGDRHPSEWKTSSSCPVLVRKQGKKRTKTVDQDGTTSAQAKGKRGKKAAKGQEPAADDAQAAGESEKHARDNAEVEDI